MAEITGITGVVGYGRGEPMEWTKGRRQGATRSRQGGGLFRRIDDQDNHEAGKLADKTRMPPKGEIVHFTALGIQLDIQLDIQKAIFLGVSRRA